MIIKQFRISVALTALAAIASVAVSAGQVVYRKAESKPLKMQRTVYLSASAADLYGVGGTPLTLVIANNTTMTIPAGTRIYWSIEHRNPSNPNSWTETTGSFLLSPNSGLGKTAQLERPWPIPPVAGPYTVKAWCLPWAAQN